MRLIAEQPRGAAIRRVAHEDLAGLGGLLEPRRDVDRIAEHAEFALAIADRAGDRDPRVHADSERQPPLGALEDALVRALERGEDGEGRALGLLRMVRRLVAHRAERGDHRIADVLLDQPAIRADVSRDEIPHRPHALVKLLGTETLGERGEPGDVGEQHGDLAGLALALLRRGAEARAAPPTEHEGLRHVGAAARAARNELDTALAAEAHAGRIAIAAGSTQHGPREGITTGQANGCRRGRRPRCAAG